MSDWHMFWQRTPSSREPSGEILLSTTTDSQKDLDNACIDVPAEPQRSTVYTQIMPGEREADGGTEHNEVLTIVDGQKMTTDPPGDDVDPLPPEMTALSVDDYNRQVHAMRAVVGDFNEVLSEDVEIPPAVLTAIAGWGSRTARKSHITSAPTGLNSRNCGDFLTGRYGGRSWI